MGIFKDHIRKFFIAMIIIGIYGIVCAILIAVDVIPAIPFRTTPVRKMLEYNPDPIIVVGPTTTVTATMTTSTAFYGGKLPGLYAEQEYNRVIKNNKAVSVLMVGLSALLIFLSGIICIISAYYRNRIKSESMDTTMI